MFLVRSESGCGVTANMLVLGTSDSGFESRHPDLLLNNLIYKEFTRYLGNICGLKGSDSDLNYLDHIKLHIKHKIHQKVDFMYAECFYF